MVAEYDCERCGSALPTADAKCQVCAATSGSGQVIFAGNYRFEKLLGKGGQGTVHLAMDLSLDRWCAVKVLQSGLTSRADLVARFRKEGRMLARLEHPNVVPVYAIGREGDLPFIVMKYLEGSTLRKLGRDRATPWTVAELTPLVRQMCAGLGYMHAQGFVHRDLKPGNIFVGPDGHVTILDLGIARDSDSTLTAPGLALGTASYMSPEHTGTAAVHPSSDVYSLGVIIFEALTGRLPFDAPSDVEMMRAHRYAPVPDASTVANVSPAVGKLLMRALAKQPDDRFASAQQFLDAWELAANRDVSAGLEPEERTTPGLVPAAAGEGLAAHAPSVSRAVTRAATAARTSSDRVSPVPPLEPLPLPRPGFPLGAVDPIAATTTVNPARAHPAEDPSQTLSDKEGDDKTISEAKPELVGAGRAPARPLSEIPMLFPVKPTGSTPVPAGWSDVVVTEPGPGPAPSLDDEATRAKPRPVDAAAARPSPAKPPPARPSPAQLKPVQARAAEGAAAPHKRVRSAVVLWLVGPLVLAVVVLLVNLNFDLEIVRDRLWSAGTRQSRRAPLKPGAATDAGVEGLPAVPEVQPVGELDGGAP